MTFFRAKSVSPQLLTKWRKGDEDAARQLFDDFSQRLTVLAQKFLSGKFAQRLDGEDVVQSVFRTFFFRSARGEFPVQDTMEIWRVLSYLTKTKAQNRARHHSYEMRDVEKEVYENDFGWQSVISSNTPDPEEVAVFAEQLEMILEGLPEEYCSILTLRLDGYRHTEIGKELGISRQTVHRAMNLLQERMRKLV